MKVNRLVSVWLIMMLCIFTFCGCNKSSSNKKVVAFVPQILNGGDYWDNITNNLRKELESNGFEFKVDGAEKWSTPLQAEVINKFVDEKVSAIIVAPTGTSELFEAFQRAREAGIKVILIDMDINSDYFEAYGTEVTSFVGVDNYKAGQEVGNVLVQKLEKGSEVAVFSGGVDNANSEERCNGFCDLVKDRGINVVARNSVPTWTTNEAYLKAKQIFKAYPNIKGVFTADGNICKGVFKAADECGVNIVGSQFDCDKETKENIESGKIACALDQDSAAMSKKVSEVVKMSLEGKQVDRVSNSEGKIIQK